MAASVDEIFASVSRRLVAEAPGVEQGKIFNATGLRTGGRFFAFVSKGELVVKLPAERVAELVASGEGQPFDAGKGRPLREWVRLSPRDEAACAAVALEAFRFVA
jgi:TfoX/Sxy family transcriptional regulator of competence genes